ncbi:hypothetical protein AB1Y20_003171 [Prymnesium parvum]|uniref:Uncharacterized protein n=1 Tax=Prymnesium parvum TaxID=97485 RepID=A0AB34JCI5_PRYPA
MSDTPTARPSPTPVLTLDHLLYTVTPLPLAPMRARADPLPRSRLPAHEAALTAQKTDRGLAPRREAREAAAPLRDALRWRRTGRGVCLCALQPRW